jgi:hypothetical protein
METLTRAPFQSRTQGSRTSRRDVRYCATPSSAEWDQMLIHSHLRQLFTGPDRSRPLPWIRVVSRESQALMLTSQLPDLCLVIRHHLLAARARRLDVSAFDLARVEHELRSRGAILSLSCFRQNYVLGLWAFAMCEQHSNPTRMHDRRIFSDTRSQSEPYPINRARVAGTSTRASFRTLD